MVSTVPPPGSGSSPGGWAAQQHLWDQTTKPAICTACLVDAYNGSAPIICPGMPFNWPASCGTYYPDCYCGINDWTIFSNAAFECNACLRQFTLPQLQGNQSRFTPAPAQSASSQAMNHTWAPSGLWKNVVIDEVPAKPVSKPETPRCTDCKRELSKEMDAYHGRDPNEARRCRPCRTGKPF